MPAWERNDVAGFLMPLSFLGSTCDLCCTDVNITQAGACPVAWYLPVPVAHLGLGSCLRAFVVKMFSFRVQHA